MQTQSKLLKPLAMSTEELRAKVKEQINQIDDVRFLKVILAMCQAYEKEFGDPVIGYEVDGTAVRASEARKQFAEDLSKPEEFMSVEDFEKELDAVTV